MHKFCPKQPISHLAYFDIGLEFLEQAKPISWKLKETQPTFNPPPNPHATFTKSGQQHFTSFEKTFNTNLLQIAAAIARSPAVSVTVNPLTTFKNTACSTKAQESRI